jgi:hypothetical protein
MATADAIIAMTGMLVMITAIDRGLRLLLHRNRREEQ